MAWIADVVPHTTIRSVWGNQVRDGTIVSVANKTERDATVIAKEGMVVYCADTHITYVRVGAAWHVIAMPWRPFTPTVWTTPVGGGAFSSLGPAGTAYWRQSMGAAQVLGTAVASLNLTGTNYWVYVSLPHTAQAPGPVGGLRCYVNQSGLAFGGWGEWTDNGGAAGTSRVQLANVGNGVPPVPTINAPVGSAVIQVGMDLHYSADPSVDTP